MMGGGGRRRMLDEACITSTCPPGHGGELRARQLSGHLHS